MPTRGGKGEAHFNWRVFFKGPPAQGREPLKVLADYLPTRTRGPRISIQESGPTWASMRLQEPRKYDSVVSYVAASSVCSSACGGAASKDCFSVLSEADAETGAEADALAARSRSPSRSLMTAAAECISVDGDSPPASAGPSAAASEAVSDDPSVSVRPAAAASEAAPQSGPAAAAGGPRGGFRGTPAVEL